jgi:hypothetical protein
MSQVEIIKFLQKQTEPVPRRIIIENLIGEMNQRTIERALKQLIEFNEVLWKEIDRFHAAQFSPGAKRKIKLYYINRHSINKITCSNF